MLLDGYREEIRTMALESITDLNRTSSEIIMICGLYCDRWQDLLHDLDPGSKAALEKIKSAGKTPTTVASTNLDELITYLHSRKIEITPPIPNTEEDNVWVLILIEDGYVWLELDPRIERKAET